ncbi:hypothetical protein TVAGG3_0998590 [Trichomonas vaginalis G3]|uniref:hypothetical protein n=1 Tax=Trichomonas vaginalis (strain ATCC PRA-98 / G3) TaxID=412133 RepID=UPI0021E5675E|nr:hypothetical protein TVAGG3_0998590 [Trichomonas vaginalis G3]KAI5490593.1 hypothetical protein TVAGG3_0998590 [Trichomonas vaginalis G3]
MQSGHHKLQIQRPNEHLQLPPYDHKQLPEEVITPNNDQGNDQKSKSGKLGAGAIAGIIIGILIIAAVCIGAFLIIKKHQLKVEKDSEDQVQFMNMV